MNLEDYNGMPRGVTPDKMPVSRSGEFSAGISGGGGTHRPTPTPYTLSSVLSPVTGNSNGQSDTTFTQNKVLDYYR